ncbi:hypothetical protein EJB05_23279, partial [Eragrostis curvula]
SAAGATAAVHNTENSFGWSFNQLQSTLFGILGKRKRENGCNFADTHLSDKNEFSRRIQHIGHKLRGVGGDVSDALKIDGSNSAGTSKLMQSTPLDTRLTSSFLSECKVYRRDAEIESIKLRASNKSSGITVLPIVGIGGVGKTTLAQQVSWRSIEIKIWVCVSDNFDVFRLTREILDCVSGQRQTETGNLNKLQEDLEKQIKYKRFLIVLDDFWDDMNEYSWNKLLGPLKRNQTLGNMILLTTRKLSVVEMTRTIEPIKLGALGQKDFWLLFKSYAFCDQKYEEHPTLYTTGKGIAQKLRGNPLAAKTVGALLRRNISIDNWTNILRNEEWKSLQTNGGIMPALKLSYDYLPYPLQQCFRYCCLFPKDYHFDGADLVRLWISQGFVLGGHTGKRLEDTGQVYLLDLVDSGFFQPVESYKYSSKHFVMHNLMHDLASEVSRAELATINGTECEEILPTVRHLSIVTDFKYLIDGCRDSSSIEGVNAFPYDSFEQKLLRVKSVRNLRSLVLIGQYDTRFFKFFQNMFKEAKKLCLLYISASYIDFDCFISNLISCTHIRYIKVILDDSKDGVLPQALIKFFHLQVLDVGIFRRPTLPSGMNKLVNLQHLVANENVHFTIDSIGNMTALQELPMFTVQNASGFNIGQLKSMNQLIKLRIYQLENVKNKEASEARLIDKGHLEDLCLLWGDGSTSTGALTETAAEVLEGLKPHQNLKHLKIIGYSGATSPSWLAADVWVSSLQFLHLENCKKWRVLPPFEKLPFLRRLELIDIRNVVEVAIPGLEELVLGNLPRL